MSFEKNLLQMKKLIKKKPAKSESLAPFVIPEKPKYTKAWEESGLKVIENDFGIVFEKKIVYDRNYCHGNFKLKEVFDAFALWNSFQGVHPVSTDGKQVVFFDTETTGLKGTGTYIFLIGQLIWNKDHFEMTQHILADPSHEAAMLYESGLWKPGQTVITYNGKSFDWPQLQTRWTLNREHLPKLSDPIHIDLLHGSRRVWRNDLDQFKLTKIEEEKLGFKRVGDIPGHLAPIIYMDAVKSGNPSTLLKVLHHNEWDILSLLTLFIHTTKLILQEQYLDSSTSSTNIGKWFSDLKDFEKGQSVFEQIITQYGTAEAAMAFYYLGYEYKRIKQFDLAYESFEKSLGHVLDVWEIKVYEELAKIAEHAKKDFGLARLHVEKALELIQKTADLKPLQKDRRTHEFKKRLERIIRKQTISRASAGFDRK
ncbi:ribonuclease H-like domain-containing protein [Paenisporosarcina quisquiliarum]|uniref:Ribonuclease H-like domain-containing protein n=1 Tax=Paenisporosarcina quisquiliarum TaxID=365346 RepID=A0A9X3RCX0_9BACL|nr:ribonuclease H-like domain-containing protein [Paenisporosarcina quisquiliarum]MCZ8535818.1 ribonuclease H-like domain-containing protein [Paenisporosarcina quisquiliarum]